MLVSLLGGLLVEGAPVFVAESAAPVAWDDCRGSSLAAPVFL
jgi:hypothetical protein